MSAPTITNGAFHALSAATADIIPLRRVPSSFDECVAAMQEKLAGERDDLGRVYRLSREITRLETLMNAPPAKLPAEFDGGLCSRLLGHYIGERSRLRTKMASDATRQLFRQSLDVSLLVARAEQVARRQAGFTGDDEDYVEVRVGDLRALNKAIVALKLSAGVE